MSEEGQLRRDRNGPNHLEGLIEMPTPHAARNLDLPVEFPSGIVASTTRVGIRSGPGEDLALLVQRWYLPFFRDVRAAAASDTPGFSPIAVMAFHSMLLGYLTLAPLHEAIFDRDPLTEDALAELLALQQRLANSAAQ